MKQIVRLLIPSVVVLTVMTAVLAADNSDPNGQSRRDLARLMADRSLLVTHWVAVEVSNQFSTNIKEMAGKFKSLDYQCRYIVPGAKDTKKQPQDDFERALLEKAAKEDASGKGQMFERAVSGQYHYYIPVRAGKSCVTVCHRIGPGVRESEFGAGVMQSAGVPAKAGGLMAVVEIVPGQKGSQ